MATDPVRTIRARDHETALDLDAHHALLAFAWLPPAEEAPYLTVYLDWRPEGADPGRRPAEELRPSQRRGVPAPEASSRRPGRSRVERELAEVLAAQGPRGAARESVEADIARIGAYLDGELDPSAQGAMVVACTGLGVFETLALGLPVPTGVVAAPTPALFPLAYLADDHPTYAVLLADGEEATVTLVDQATPRRSVALRGSDYPRRQGTGGLAQRRLKARAGERVAAFARAIAEETQRALDEAEVDMLVVAGAEPIAGALDEAFHATVKDRIVAAIRLDLSATEAEILDATLPLVAGAEREREGRAVAALRDALGASGRGAAGAEATLLALQKGQVAELLLVDDFAAAGWADLGKGVWGVGPVPDSHPTGGDPAALRPVALEHELVRLAAQTGARVQVVHTAVLVGAGEDGPIPAAGRPAPRAEPAASLDGLGGVGALLRFALDPGPGAA